MSVISDFIESGILEVYVLRAATAEEAQEVERMAAGHPEVRQEIDRITRTMEGYAAALSVSPKPAIKPILLASIDYLGRMEKGEQAADLPRLTKTSRKEDYTTWLDREDLADPADFEQVFVKFISITPEATTAVIWVKEMPYYEVHDEEHESFLILEGTCDLILEEEIFALGPGDYFAIPLHTSHTVKVTSDVPCKAILQRLAV